MFCSSKICWLVAVLTSVPASVQKMEVDLVHHRRHKMLPAIERCVVYRLGILPWWDGRVPYSHFMDYLGGYESWDVLQIKTRTVLAVLCSTFHVVYILCILNCAARSTQHRDFAHSWELIYLLFGSPCSVGFV